MIKGDKSLGLLRQRIMFKASNIAVASTVKIDEMGFRENTASICWPRIKNAQPVLSSFFEPSMKIKE